ncbi:MAG: PAS domain-containing protein, partial [Desulfuromonadales bacterium]|nr:PAS domain-containing protein [Desulfuromonadales bacterium]NIR33917.1 PAS domain-containing protein [Desulfuromonadales bacterium]NIS43915.1 PAS domain-containing protein [Desulfuromonadales bacterium]
MAERALLHTVKPVRRRILLPLVVTLLVFLLLFALGARAFLRHTHQQVLDNQYHMVWDLFYGLLDENRRLMQVTLDRLARDEKLRQAMADGRRDALQSLAKAHFVELEQLGITHLYIHDPSGRNVLRAHAPERHGDQIKRLSMQKAMAARERAGGMELGPFGTFTLREVIPWQDDGAVIGFLEMGVEVAPLIDRVKQLARVELLLTLHKEFLDRDKWAGGMRMRGRTPRWDQFHDRVVLDQTHHGIDEKVGEFLREPYLSGLVNVEMQLDEHNMVGRFMALENAADVRVGAMLVLIPDDPFRQIIFRQMGWTVALCAFFGATLTGIAFVILGRFDKRLLATHRALKSSHDNLEVRVEERTEELRQHNRLLRDLIIHIPDMVAWKDRHGIYRGGNPAVLSLAGLDHTESLEGRSDAELRWPLELRRFLSDQTARAVSSAEAQIDQEVEIQLPDSGESRYLLVSTVPLGDAESTQGMLIILRDVTEHKLEDAELEKAYAEARTSRDRLDGIIASVPDALFVTDVDDRLVLINDEAESLVDISAENALGRQVREVIRQPWLADRIAEALAQRHLCLQFDAVRPTGDGGHDQVYQVRTSVIVTAEGRFDGLVFSARDVSEERRIDSLKSQFISTAAHELRTPLTVIFGFAELLAESDFGAEQQKEYLNLIVEKAGTMSELLDDLLDLSRLESGRPLQINKAHTPVRDVFTPDLAAYRRLATDHRFKVDLRETAGGIEVDAAKIAQVMDNLLSNAIKYSPAGGTVRIAGEPVDGAYRVSVSDEGIGMTTAQCEKAFEKFYRVDASDTAVSGTGLGLTIAEHIVTAHGGRIWIVSVPGRGTTVSFELPLSEADE